MSAPERVDGTGERWWRWHGHVIDLLGEPGQTPAFVGPAVLAHRDAVTEEDSDMADFLAWLIEDHPPWNGGCAACRTAGPCTVQSNAQRPVTEWLITRTRRIQAQPRERNTCHALRRSDR